MSFYDDSMMIFSTIAPLRAAELFVGVNDDELPYMLLLLTENKAKGQKTKGSRLHS
jgi:hypothetical protein